MVDKPDIIKETVEEHVLKTNSIWRIHMSYMYMTTCIFDFILAPVIMPIIEAYYHQPIVQWTPLTLQGGGLYHMAMGAIIGITTYSKSKEQLNAMAIYATGSPQYGYPNPQQPNNPPSN